MGEFIYLGGKEGTVIDYVLMEKEVRNKVERMETWRKIDSDYEPVVMYMKSKTEGKQGVERETE